MSDGQAYVVEERCISCGTCIRECPQRAKTYRRDLDHAQALCAKGGIVAASVAPSFAALFNEWERLRLPSALRRLGFRHVGETAVGAYHVARATAQYVAEHPNVPHIASACPAVVNYIEQYAPDLTSYLVPCASPMLVHARMLKKRFGPTSAVVFIGPCVAKKAEAQRQENKGVVDCALTFEEMMEWFEHEGIVLSQCEESSFDETPEGSARFFPVPGGLMRTAAMEEDMISENVLAVSGMEEVREALECAAQGNELILIEPLLCPEGCASGPGMPCSEGLYHRRNQVIGYAKKSPSASDLPPITDEVPLTAKYAPRKPAGGVNFSEEEIRKGLADTGKARPEDQLNCGACGYATCRDKTIANLSGMAEPEMCVPQMRRLAEQRMDRIIATSPNGILILDERLNILAMNPAFRQMFLCSDSVLGKPVSYLMDPAPFEQLASGADEVIDVTMRHDNYNITCHEKLYPLHEEKQYVGIFVNITKSQEDEQQLQKLRSETVSQARELLEHQIRAAQEMAQHLGETTARGEALVRNLLHLVAEEGEITNSAPMESQRRDYPWGTRI
jgi:uncharacterized Fe-S cluster-containing protein/Fe-S-cluster-containing hydrogenase component 2